MGTSVAATCWQMLIALQLPRHECFLMRHRTPRDFETLSEVDETIIPAIAELEPVRIQPDTITSEAHLDARWDYIRGLARAGVEGPPRQAGVDTEAQQQRQKNMKIALLNMKRGCNCTLHSSLQYTASWRSPWPRRPLRDRGGQLTGLRHGGEDPSYMRSETQR